LVNLKQAITSSLVLPLLDFIKPFIVEYDAFIGGVKVDLTQDGRPIYYLSKCLKAKELVLSNYKKEILAIVLVIYK
jgi:hypothetical protein